MQEDDVSDHFLLIKVWPTAVGPSWVLKWPQLVSIRSTWTHVEALETPLCTPQVI